MKKFVLTLLFVFATLVSYSQTPRMHHFKPAIDFNQYEVIDSLPLERITIHFNNEVDDENLISLGSGDYMAPLPHKDKMVIKTNSDRTKAIVLYNSYAFGRHLEFDIKENDRRLILWHKDKRVYCGYIYDKKYKVAQYFESKKEYKRFMKHNMFERPQ